MPLDRERESNDQDGSHILQLIEENMYIIFMFRKEF
jgi:hypothetical protein